MIGPVVRQLRQQRKLSQEALANTAHVSSGYLSKLERGVYKAPSIEVLSGKWSVPATVVEEPRGDRRSFTLSKDAPMQWPVLRETWGTIGGRLLQARGGGRHAA